jgi:hypothetical protein
MRRLLAVTTLSILLLSACAERATPGNGSGGGEIGTIHGTVVIGPTCPVERAESPCPDRPVDGVAVQALLDGSVSATAVSDASGEFTMDLAPGEYLLQAVVEPEGPGMYSAPMRVIVRGGSVVSAIVFLDSGIRAPVAGG